MNALLYREYDSNFGMEYDQAEYIQNVFLNSQQRKEIFEELGIFDNFEYGIAEFDYSEYENDDEYDDYIPCYYFYIMPPIELQENYPGNPTRWLHEITAALNEIVELEDYEIIMEEL